MNAPESETPKERINRELTELLGELRVALPGVQMLFAFLLTVPFHETFSRLSETQRTVFYLTFVATTIAAIFLIAPSSHHRIAFRDPEKEQLLLRANAFAIIGTAFLALAICGVMFVISGMLFGGTWAPWAALATFTLIATTWYLVPIVRKIRRHAAQRE